MESHFVGGGSAVDPPRGAPLNFTHGVPVYLLLLFLNVCSSLSGRVKVDSLAVRWGAKHFAQHCKWFAKCVADYQTVVAHSVRQRSKSMGFGSHLCSGSNILSVV